MELREPCEIADDIFSNRNVNWKSYVEYWKMAVGQASRLAHEVLDFVNGSLIREGLVTSGYGFMMYRDGRPETLIHGRVLGEPLKFVNEKDARSLGRELYPNEDLDVISFEEGKGPRFV